MRAIWTDENKLKLWLQIELLTSEALVKEGVVPAKDFKKIKAGCDKWFADLPGLVARQRELEKTLNHDVIAFTTAVAEQFGRQAGGDRRMSCQIRVETQRPILENSPLMTEDVSPDGRDRDHD